MLQLLKRFCTRCRDSALPHIRQASREHAATVQEAVERVVDGIEPRLRLVPGYRRKLQQATATALDYVNELVDRIPPVLEVTPATFVSDPQVNAFFATPEDLRNIFSQSPELRAFFDDIANSEATEGYALLCTTEHEKTLLGSELNGDILRRDVMQTAVYFSEHKVMSPAPSEADVRRGLKQCIFDALVIHALRHIANLKSQRRDLEDQRRILHARLRARQAQGNGLTRLLASAYPEAEASTQQDLEQQLAETEQKLARMPASLDVLGGYLDEVRTILAQPQAFIRLRLVTFNLDRMGIKVGNGSSQAGQQVRFAEIEIVNVLKRVVALVRYPRREMLEQRSVI
ncbi:MAG: hypothetical protein J5I92_09800 [Thiogranum sp.]|nr:hypothetical protein [Thiogranum sp.]